MIEEIIMSESTAVLDQPTDAPVADVVTETAPTTELPPIYSASDKSVPVSGAFARFAELYGAATAQPTAIREELDKRAIAQWVRSLSAEIGDTTQVSHLIELPRYDGLGPAVEGSKRYTPQRAMIAAAVADANGVASKVFFTRYTYPGPTKRKAHVVRVFGTREDVQRTLAMYELFTARAIHDAYVGEHNAPLGTVFTPEQVAKPAQQTRARRAWMREWVTNLDATLGEQKLTPKVQHALLARMEAAEAAMTAFVAENAEANLYRSDAAQVEVETEMGE